MTTKFWSQLLAEYLEPVGPSVSYLELLSGFFLFENAAGNFVRLNA